MSTLFVNIISKCQQVAESGGCFKQCAEKLLDLISSIVKAYLVYSFASNLHPIYLSLATIGDLIQLAPVIDATGTLSEALSILV